MEELQAAFDGGYQEALRFSVAETLAYYHGLATAILAYYGYGPAGRPDIVSGYRDPARQRELRERWDRGDRAGIAFRPAERSWHTVGQAIDVQTNVDGFPFYRDLMEYFGVSWGGHFGDYPHFYVPLGDLAPSIYDI